MSEKLTSSWADEVDDVEPQPKSTGNAWAKGNPYGITVNSQSDSRRDYDKDFPTADDKHSNERSHDNHREDYNRRDDYGRDYSHQRRDDHRDDRDYQSRDRDEGYRRPDYNNRDRDYNRDRPERSNYRRDDREGGYRDRRDNRDREFNRDRPDYNNRDRDFNRDRDYNRDRQDRPPFRNREPREPRPPREPVPFPTSAPFTAFVGNLPYNVVSDDLYKFFESDPDVKVLNVRLLEQPGTGRLKGFGYVEFENLESLKKAVARNEETLFERPLKIDVAEAKPEEKPRDSWGSRGPRRAPADEQGAPREDTSPKERQKLELKPKSSAETTAASGSPALSEAYKKTSKPNPFGDARPRDENEILKKKEERRRKASYFT